MSDPVARLTVLHDAILGGVGAFALLLLIPLSGCTPPEASAPTPDETISADVDEPQPVPQTAWDEGVDLTGGVSANGRFLSFTDWSTGNLVLRDLTTGEDRRITDKGSYSDAYEFAVGSFPSPDGSRVAYNWFKDSTVELRLAGLAGTEPRVLHQPGSGTPAWSPDGRYLAAAVPAPGGIHQIVVFTVEDGSQRVLTEVDERSAGYMSFAPDGRYLAYDVRRTDEAPERDIFVISVAGSRNSLVVDHPADDFLLGWSAEGGDLLFASDRRGTLDAWAIPVADGVGQGAPELVVSDLGPEIGPLGSTTDGSVYYRVVDRRDDLYVATLDPQTGQLSAPELVVRDVAPVTAPEWSANGQHLAYVARRGRDPNTPFASVVTIRSAETGEERTLPPLSFGPINLASGLVSQPRWSPDGGSLLFIGPGGFVLWRVDSQTGALARLVTEPPSVSTWIAEWSADGTGVVKQGQDISTPTVWFFVTRDLETGEEREVGQYFPPPHGGERLVLSPDGGRLAFIGGFLEPGAPILSEAVRVALWVVPAVGGDPQELFSVTRPERLVGLDWTPDGRHLVFGRGRVASGDERFELWRISTDGGEPEPLGLAMEGIRLLGLSVHPDGRRIAFTAGPSPQYVARVVTGFSGDR